VSNRCWALIYIFEAMRKSAEAVNRREEKEKELWNLKYLKVVREMFGNTFSQKMIW